MKEQKEKEFWTELSKRLGEKDFYDKYSQEDVEKMSKEEKNIKLQENIVKWECELADKGLDRVGLVEKKDSDFDCWNSLKKKLHNNKGLAYAHPREIWWCSLGHNIGVEMNGKNESFERPVLIIKMYNKEKMLVLPITSKEKNDIFHFKIKAGDKNVWVSLAQSRVISNRRLLRKVDVLAEEGFEKVRNAFSKYI